MKNQQMRDRTKQFALRIIRMYCSLPKTTEAQVLGKQILRSGTSVAANYREASRSRSDAELIAKMGLVEQELDETLLWMELLTESDIVKENRMTDLYRESEELLRMVVTSIKTLKSRKQSKK